MSDILLAKGAPNEGVGRALDADIAGHASKENQQVGNITAW
jgi:hypothetical protein